MIRTARRAVRLWAAFRQRVLAGGERIAVAAPIAGGRLEYVVIHGDATIAAEGSAANLDAFRRTLTLRVGDRTLPPTHAFRTRRRNVAHQLTGRESFLGAVAEWALDPQRDASTATLMAGGRPLVGFQLPPTVALPYAHLRTETRVLGRDAIYTSGLPACEASREVLALTRSLPAPILDFGCGAGALLRDLRRHGIEAYGLELDADRIRQQLLPEVRSFITLYDGRLPAPFGAGDFASIVCAEVLEHLPAPIAALDEFARLARRTVFITVPDMSAIPRGYPHRVVPWHLLESTHVNFFTQQSLEQAVAPYAASVEIARIGQVQCERLQYYTSLAATVTLK